MSIELPNFHVLEKLGVGAETRVFRARDTRTGQDYAVKIVKLSKPEDVGYIDLLRAEYSIGSVIKHPAVRKVFELRMIRQRFRVRGAVLFMEYVDGMAMADKEFRRPHDEILRLFGLVADGLRAMHVAGFVHADLKPGNILVTPDGQVKLIDFGQSAKLLEAKPRVQGTINYIAPEQVQRGVLDHRTDVFGFGAVLQHVLTGRPIQTEMNQTVSVYSQGLVGKRVSEIRETTMESLPPCIAKLIVDCCKMRSEDRIPDMLSLMERIRLARAILAKQEAIVAAGAGPAELDDDEDMDDDPAEFGYHGGEENDGQVAVIPESRSEE